MATIGFSYIKIGDELPVVFMIWDKNGESPSRVINPTIGPLKSFLKI